MTRSTDDADPRRVAAHPHRRRRDHAPRHHRRAVPAAREPIAVGDAASTTARSSPGAVEELLRWVSPIKNMARTATRDVELVGKQIKEGQKLLMLYPSANRDEDPLRRPRRRSTSRARRTTTLRSASGPTSALAHRSRASRSRSRSNGCSNGSPTSTSSPTPNRSSGPRTSSVATSRCRSSSRQPVPLRRSDRSRCGCSWSRTSRVSQPA